MKMLISSLTPSLPMSSCKDHFVRDVRGRVRVQFANVCEERLPAIWGLVNEPETWRELGGKVHCFDIVLEYKRPTYALQHFGGAGGPQVQVGRKILGQPESELSHGQSDFNGSPCEITEYSEVISPFEVNSDGDLSVSGASSSATASVLSFTARAPNRGNRLTLDALQVACRTLHKPPSPNATFFVTTQPAPFDTKKPPPCRIWLWSVDLGSLPFVGCWDDLWCSVTRVVTTCQLPVLVKYSGPGQALSP